MSGKTKINQLESSVRGSTTLGVVHVVSKYNRDPWKDSDVPMACRRGQCRSVSSPERVTVGYDKVDTSSGRLSQRKPPTPFKNFKKQEELTPLKNQKILSNFKIFLSSVSLGCLLRKSLVPHRISSVSRLELV